MIKLNQSFYIIDSLNKKCLVKHLAHSEGNHSNVF